jgi:hypothetical protein
MEESRALALDLSCTGIDAVAFGVFKSSGKNAALCFTQDREAGGKKAFTSISAGLPFASLARPGGGTGRRAGLKIPYPKDVWVRPPPRAPAFAEPTAGRPANLVFCNGSDHRFSQNPRRRLRAIGLAQAGITPSMGNHPYALRLLDRKRKQPQPTLRWPDSRSQDKDLRT